MKRLCLICMLSLGVASIFATHNRSGLITYEQIDQLTIKATIITYTRASSLPADRDTLIICWGDGQSEKVSRDNDDGQLLEGDYKRNIYSATHIYATVGQYILCMTDPNRNAGIINVNPPNSGQVAFHLQTTIKLVDFAAVGGNKSPELLHHPTDLAYAGFPFVYNPNVVDAEGDSIAFELITPMRDVNDPVPNYMFPDEVDSGTNNTFTLDEATGEVRWDVPQLVGEYNIAILIKSYRHGDRIDAMVLDMQIAVLAETPNAATDLAPDASWIKIAPNPVQNRLLRVENSHGNKATPYVIVDASGRKVGSGQLRESLGEIALPTLSAGTYFISLEEDGKWWSKTFQVME